MTQQEFFNRFTYSVREDKISGGAFGTVYKAYDNLLNREVAVKVSEVKLINGKEFSLKDEFEAIKNLPKHANIANYEELHTFEAPNGIFDYAIIQYYKDGNLSQVMSQGLNAVQKQQIAIDLLQGIIHLHKHKVVHRDLKPSNILIVCRGDKVIPIITDFGLSKEAFQDAQSRFTNSFGGGTLKYSSPEQLRGEELRLNTDLWSYGVIVTELFNGYNIFSSKVHKSSSAEAEKEIMEKILKLDIKPEINKLPAVWQEPIKKCLERDPSKRIKEAISIEDYLIKNKVIKPTEKPVVVSKPVVDEKTKQKDINVIDLDKIETNNPIPPTKEENPSETQIDTPVKEQITRKETQKENNNKKDISSKQAPLKTTVTSNIFLIFLVAASGFMFIPLLNLFLKFGSSYTIISLIENIFDIYPDVPLQFALITMLNGICIAITQGFIFYKLFKFKWPLVILISTGLQTLLIINTSYIGFITIAFLPILNSIVIAILIPVLIKNNAAWRYLFLPWVIIAFVSFIGTIILPVFFFESIINTYHPAFYEINYIIFALFSALVTGIFAHAFFNKNKSSQSIELKRICISKTTNLNYYLYLSTYILSIISFIIFAAASINAYNVYYDMNYFYITSEAFYYYDVYWNFDYLSHYESQVLFAFAFLSASFFLYIISIILRLYLLHNAWASVQQGKPYTTPDNAVGFLFVPFFNLYWIFIAYNTLFSEIRKFKPTQNVGSGLAITVCIVSLIPFVNLINIILMPILIYNIRKHTLSILRNTLE